MNQHPRLSLGPVNSTLLTSDDNQFVKLTGVQAWAHMPLLEDEEDNDVLSRLESEYKLTRKVAPPLKGRKHTASAKRSHPVDQVPDSNEWNPQAQVKQDGLPLQDHRPHHPNDPRRCRHSSHSAPDPPRSRRRRRCDILSSPRHRHPNNQEMACGGIPHDLTNVHPHQPSSPSPSHAKRSLHSLHTQPSATTPHYLTVAPKPSPALNACLHKTNIPCGTSSTAP